MIYLVFLTIISLTISDVTIDLSQAKIDPETGYFCVTQKVCVANPPEALTRSSCAPSFPTGCDCDPAGGPGAGDICPVNRPKCVQCRCLALGCDCDNEAVDPNSFCTSGDVCKDCQCQSRIPPGCDCDLSSPDPDLLCPLDLRCVGCKCQSCPQSGGQGNRRGRSPVINPPLVFVIDTTKSVKPDKDSIFNLTKSVTDRIMKDGINIPRYQLFTFNDFGPEVNLNVNLEVDTDSVTEFAKATHSLVFESYNGGRDSKERLAQGLMVALQNVSPKSLVVVFTDNGSKDLRLERDIIRLSKAKQSEVYIVLTPVYEGRFNGKSLTAYGRMGKVFLIEEVGADFFLKSVEDFEESNCI